MPEHVTAQRKITFKTGLPLGRHATFTHEGQRWIAVPQDKYVAIVTVTDRLIGTLNRVREDITRLLAGHPEDATRITRMLQIIAAAHAATAAAAVDKVKAQTA